MNLQGTVLHEQHDKVIDLAWRGGGDCSGSTVHFQHFVVVQFTAQKTNEKCDKSSRNQRVVKMLQMTESEY